MGCFLKWIFPVVFLLLFLSIYLHFEPPTLPEIKTNKAEITIVDDYTLWYYFVVVFITALIAYITWSQFHKTNNSLRAECLLKMDARFGSPEILKARTIIHEKYRNHYKTEASGEKAIKATAKEIIELSESEKQEEFVCLLNILDLLDTVGFLHSEGHLSEDRDINALFGPYLKLYLGVFLPYVCELNEPGAYESFKKLQEVLNSTKKNCHKHCC
jgi:hypothetical protein